MKITRRSMLRFASVAVAALAFTSVVGCGGSSTSGSNSPKAATGNSVISSDGTREVVKESAVVTFEKGISQAKSDPNGAISTFKKAADEQDNFAEAYYNIGLLQQQQGNNSDARSAYEKAMKMRPDMPEPYVNISKMLLEEGKLDEAEQILLKVVDEKTGVDPFCAEANLNMGMIYRLRGEAILEKERGGSEPKFSMEGAENKGEIKNKDAYNMFAKAVFYVRRALASDSNNIYCYENLCAIYYLMNSLEIASLVCEQATLKYREYNEELEKQKAAGRITQEEYDRKAYTPKDLAAVYNTTGLIYLAQGDVAMGNGKFKEAVAADPNNIQAMLNVAGIAVNVQDYQLAYDYYNKVLALQPDNISVYLSKGVAARGLGKLDEAEKIYKEIMNKHPEYPQAWFNYIILVQEYQNKIDDARKMWTEFVAAKEPNDKIPGRVEEAKERIKQIDAQKEAQRKAEADAAEMERRMKEMEELQRKLEQENQ